MKLIIDIDDEDYKQIQDINSAFNGFTARLYSTIRKGTPLPKGHGRIIDESKINKCGWNFVNHHAKTDAPTIIEGSESE